jgi:hypothetical protein
LRWISVEQYQYHPSSGRRKHIREKGDAKVGAGTKKKECISTDMRMKEN